MVKEGGNEKHKKYVKTRKFYEIWLYRRIDLIIKVPTPL